MSRPVSVFAVAVAVSALGCASDAIEEPSTSDTPVPLSIATWNVDNFFNDRVDDILPDPQFVPENLDPNYLQKMQALGAVIREANPDLLMLQEVEHDRLARELDETELGAQYPYVAHFDGNDPRGIDLVLLSKLPLDAAYSHREEIVPGANFFRRDVLHVRLTVNGRELVLLGVHLKANEVDPVADARADANRRAEAERVRFIADLKSRGRPEATVVVLGDFNDLPGSPAVSAVRGDDFFNVIDYVPEAERFTFVFDDTPEAIDHQLVNPFGQQFLRGGTIYRSGGASDHDMLVGFYEFFAPEE